MAARHASTARRLLSRLVIPLLARPSIPSQRNPFRAISGRKPPVSPPAPSRKPSPESFRFVDIPLAAFEHVIANSGNSFRRLSPKQYHACADKFVQLVRQKGGIHAVRGSSLPAAVLHDIGCILRHIPGAQKLGTAMWVSASEMGFDPSTISLAWSLIGGGFLGKIPSMRRVEDRFRQLVAAGKDPNALTAEAGRLYREGRFDAAAVMLQKALRIGSEGFEWKPACQLSLARTYLKLGRTEEARDLLDALTRLGLLEAEAELGKLLRATDPGRARQHLYAAARGGQPELFRHLSEMALEEAESPGGTCREDARRWAMEWSRLANLQADH